MDIDQSLDAMIKSAPKKGPKGAGGGKKKAKPAKGKGPVGKKVGGVKTKVTASGLVMTAPLLIGDRLVDRRSVYRSMVFTGGS